MVENEKKSFSQHLCTALVLAGSWLFITHTPARASSQICDSYSLELSARELDEAALNLRYNMPASQVRDLLKIEVRNTDEYGPIGPYSAEKQRVIYVPRGFRRLQCRLLQYEFYVMNRHIAPPPDLTARTVACTRQSGPAKCFEEFIVRPASELEAKYPYDAANAARLIQLANTAFDNVMMHEAAHIISETAGPSSNVVEITEVQADLLALAAGMSAGNPQIGAVATPAMMSLLDSTYDSAEEVHPPAACRAATNGAIVREIGPQIEAIYQWVINPAEYSKMRSRSRSLGLQIWVPDDRAVCAPIDMTHIKAVRADWDVLLTILDSIRIIPKDELLQWEQNEKFRIWRDGVEASLAELTVDRRGRRGNVNSSRKDWERHPEERQFDAILDKLLHFTPQTAEGQRLRATVSSLWIARWITETRIPAVSSDPMMGAQSGRLVQLQNEIKQRHHVLSNLDRLERSWAELTRYDIASEDYGRLLGSRAIFTYLGSPPGSSIKKAAGQLLKSLNEADLYYSGSINAQTQRGIAALLTGQCALARSHLKQARQELVKVANVPIAMIDTIIASDDAACARINQEMRMQLKRDLQWVD